MKKKLATLLVATSLLVATPTLVSCNKDNNGSETKGMEYSGIGEPPAALGVDGDTYKDTESGKMYKKVAGKWVLQEDEGSKSYSGEGAPSASLGKDGDKYTNTVNGDEYTKQGGVWILTKRGDTTYTVTFDLDGGHFSDGSTTWPTQTVREGKWVEEPYMEPVKDNCTFLGWYARGSSTPWNFTGTPVQGNVDLVAKWQVNEEVKITLTIDPNNGQATYTHDTFAGDKYYPDSPSKEGYDFIGWYIDGEAYSGKVTAEMAGKTLVAQYDKASFNMVYQIETNNEVTITGIINIESVSVTVPSSIGGRKVTKISKTAFNSRVYLKTIYIPSTVTVIEEGAFRGTMRLATISVDSSNPRYATVDGVLYSKDMTTLVCAPTMGVTAYSCPSTLKRIANYAFYDSKNNGLTSIIFNEGLEEIGDYAFYMNETVSSLTFPSTLKKIGRGAFYGPSFSEDEGDYSSPQGVISNINWNDGLEEIGAFAFCNQWFKETYAISSTVKSIGEFAFGYCSAIEKFIFPRDLEYLAPNAFGGCTGMLDIGIEDGNTHFKVEDGILYTFDMKTLVMCPSGRTEAVTIPEGVEELAQQAFWMVDELQEYNFPSTLKTIGYECFAQTYGLKSFVIPDTVTSIGEDCFYESGLTSVTIGAGLTEIPDGAFSTTKLTSVVIPDNITKIGEGAFEYCAIKDLTLGNNLKEIGDNAFISNSIKELVMPDSLETIGDVAFMGNSITEFNIKKGLKNIGELVFTQSYDSPKTTITSITVDPQNPYFVVNGAYLMNKEGTEILFASLGATQESGALVIPNTVKKIGSYAFAYNTAITSVDFGTGVEEIGMGAFMNTKFSEIVIPSNVKVIGEGAFYFSYATKLTLNEGLEEIGEYAFKMSDITAVTIPNSVKKVGAYAFYKMMYLTSMVLGSGIEEIGDFAFADNKAANDEVVIPAATKSIGVGAFASTVWNNGQNYGKIVVAEGNQYFSTDANGFLLMDKAQTKIIGIAGQATVFNIPSTVTEIASYGLANKNVPSKMIAIPNTVTKIADHAFAFLSVTTITIGTDVSYIGEEAFENWTKNQSIIFKVSRDFALQNYHKNYLSRCNAVVSYIGE